MGRSVLHQLNPAQQEAVEHDSGPLLVLAGAGSGKTRVVTQRISRLIARGVPPRAIVAMTFTNKAAGEMHERVKDLVGTETAKPLTICTFHRFGLTVLGAETKALGLRGKSFAIFDQSDCVGVLRELLRTVAAGRNFDIPVLLERISNAKNAFLEPEAWLEVQRNSRGLDEYDEMAMVLYPQYLSALRAFQAFDFDDLVCEVVRLWKRRPDVLERWQTRFRYLIVDEYQDTNRAQFELVRLLAAGHRNVCVVGDDDQSIYAWRGADVRNILDFEEHFPGAKVTKLEHNYRSCKAILDVANAVLARSTARRHKKTLLSVRSSDDKVRIVVAPDADAEAVFVAREIGRLTEQENVRPRDVAVLYRSNLQAPPIELALKERRIPMRMIGGQQFYERKEVKDVLAYLRVVVNPDDELALRRVLNYPSRGIGDAALTKLTDYATARDQSLWAVVAKPHSVNGLSPAALDGCREFVRIVELTRSRFESGGPCAAAVQSLIDDIGLRADLLAASQSGKAFARRWSNTEGLVRLFGRRDEKGKGDYQSFKDFLRVLALREQESEEESDRVTLTTMHGAKGLEFKYVFVVGLEEGLMPHSRSIDERATDVSDAGDEGASNSLEEERRLFYVAVTRARDRLYLCRSKLRGFRGKMAPRTPSRFVLEIPEELVELCEAENEAPASVEQVRTGAASVLAALLAGAPPTSERPR